MQRFVIYGIVIPTLIIVAFAFSARAAGSIHEVKCHRALNQAQADYDLADGALQASEAGHPRVVQDKLGKILADQQRTFVPLRTVCGL